MWKTLNDTTIINIIQILPGFLFTVLFSSSNVSFRSSFIIFWIIIISAVCCSLWKKHNLMYTYCLLVVRDVCWTISVLLFKGHNSLNSIRHHNQNQTGFVFCSSVYQYIMSFISWRLVLLVEKTSHWPERDSLT